MIKKEQEVRKYEKYVKSVKGKERYITMNVTHF
jgi:hypothetical protein